MAIPELETLHLADGTSAGISKTPGLGTEEWREMKQYLQENPEEARKMETFYGDSKAVKSWMKQRALEEFYDINLSSGDDAMASKLFGLEKNPEFAHIVEDVKRGGVQAALQHSLNEPLMLKISRAVGGVPEEAKAAFARIQSKPISLQEACKMGDIKAVENYLEAAGGSSKLEATDSKGVTCLGYAIGANRVTIVKLLLDKKADASKCDLSGANGVHYAAAYGRKELLTCLIDGKVDVNAKNTQGQTPLALATRNKQKDAIEILKSKGGAM